MAGDSIFFTPNGQPEREMVLTDGSLAIMLSRDPQVGVHASLFLQATRPGETPDDRGVPGWDAPVVLEITTHPRPASDLAYRDQRCLDGVRMSLEPDTDPRSQSGFFMYWDHHPFATLDLQFAANPSGAYRITGQAENKAGDACRFTLHLPIERFSLRLSEDSEVDADLLAQEKAEAEHAMGVYFEPDVVTWSWRTQVFGPKRQREYIAGKFRDL